jgi:hypothetical protein
MSMKAKQIVREMLEEQWEPWMDKLLELTKARWIEERTVSRGNAPPKMSLEQAKILWKLNEPDFRKEVQTNPKWRQQYQHYGTPQQPW